MPQRESRLINPAASEVMDLVLDFAGRLTAAVDRAALARAKDALDLQFGTPRGTPRGTTRTDNGPAPLRKSWTSLADVRDALPSALSGKPPRKKPPRQFCPVPGCKNTAAPIYGMVCADHKDVPKTKIKKYREQRRAAAERERSGKAKAKKS